MNSAKAIPFFLICAIGISASVLAQGNSTRKIRVKPGEFSSQCGSAVRWLDDVDAALTESSATGKPVFWYVPTIGGSFMDRKPEIDRYMMAGPFSWPAVVKLINDNFVPVRAVANGELQKKHQLERFKFVEPGFVVIGTDGSIITTVDQLTTLDPAWFSSLIAGIAGVKVPSFSPHGELDVAWNALRTGDYDVDLSSLKSSDEHKGEHILLSGMLAFRQGQHAQAREIWRTARQLAPDHPLSWKAAAEAENWGPFVRGFEVHRTLPAEAYTAGVQSRGSAAPHRIYDEDQLWERSTGFLLSMQNAQGGWVDSDYDFGGTDSLPNVYVAVTSLCGCALLESLERMPDRKEALLDAIVRAADYCCDDENLNPVDRDEILWAHAYRVRFLARLVSLNDGFRKKFTPALEKAVADLESIQTPRGTWYHEYANSFVTATALTALKRAESAGVTVDAEKTNRGVASLANDRFNNGAFPYSGVSGERDRSSPQSSGTGQIPAAAGRMPLCELALWQWNASDDSRLQQALAAAFENHRHLAVAYKYDDHTSRMAYGGFFFWYDMRSRAEALSHMEAGEQRDEYATIHHDLVLDLPELDGCFVDSHELGRCYGTAMALLTLSILDDIQ